MLDEESKRVIELFSQRLQVLRAAVEENIERIKEENRAETNDLLNRLDILDGIIGEYSSAESEAARQRYVEAAMQSFEMLGRLEALIRDQD